MLRSLALKFGLPREEADEAVDRMPPDIPDHQLLRRIGRGSYGEVWLARNLVGSFRVVTSSEDSTRTDREYRH